MKINNFSNINKTLFADAAKAIGQISVGFIKLFAPIFSLIGKIFTDGAKEGKLKGKAHLPTKHIETNVLNRKEQQICRRARNDVYGSLETLKQSLSDNLHTGQIPDSLYLDQLEKEIAEAKKNLDPKRQPINELLAQLELLDGILGLVEDLKCLNIKNLISEFETPQKC